MRPDARLVWATKGLEAETGRLLQDVAREALGDQIPLAVISGPTFARTGGRFTDGYFVGLYRPDLCR